MASHDVFLSCVSNEFHKDAGLAFVSYRDELHDRLHSAGFHVAVQENFSEHGGDLLQKLEAYIQDCRCVIHLVGDMTGARARDDEVHALFQRCPGFLAQRPGLRAALGDGTGLSYTQWEALFAIHHDKPIFRYRATDTAPRSPCYVRDNAQVILQHAHWDRLKDTGFHPGSFTDQRDLCLQVFQALHREHLLSDAAARPHQPICNLPQRSLGPLFKGREQFLSDLRATLIGGGKAAAIVQGHGLHGTRPAAISALGGVGKTRTAIEYGWQHAPDYDALLFVSAASPQMLKDQLAALTGPLVLNLADQCGPEVDQQYAATLKWLHDHPRWLLILDNADTEESQRAVTDLLARLTHGHVCITTRLSQWPDSVQPLDLQVLTDEAGAAYLLEATAGQRATAPDDEPQARALSQRLDGLALALEHAAAYIKKLRLSFSAYLDKLATSAEAVLRWHDGNQVQYPKSVAETWLITFAQLNDDERELLNILSWLDPAPIPVWLVQPLRVDDPQPQPRELLAGLAAWCLINWSEDAQTFKVHRLVQEVTRLRLADDVAQKRSLDQAIEWLDKAVLGSSQDPSNWPRWIPAAPHALCLSAHSEKMQNWWQAIYWCVSVGSLYQFRAQYDRAQTLICSALTLADAYLPSDDALLAVVLNNRALLSTTLGQFQEAELLYRRAIAIYETTLGWNHPDVVSCLTNFGDLLRATGRLTDAESLHRHALAIEEKASGLEHHNVAICLDQLGILLRDMNRLAEAEPLFRRALAIDEKTFGPDHHQVASHLILIAVLLRETNRQTDAEPLYRRALAIHEKIYGLEHPYVAADLNNLAGFLRETNRFREAEQLYRRVLAITEKTFAPDHPHVATVLNNLALLLRNTNRRDEAEPLYRRALAIDEKAYGPEHSKVAGRLTNLAALLHTWDRNTEALPLIQLAVDILQRSGEEHGYVPPDFANAQKWLKGIQRALG